MERRPGKRKSGIGCSPSCPSFMVTCVVGICALRWASRRDLRTTPWVSCTSRRDEWRSLAKTGRMEEAVRMSSSAGRDYDRCGNARCRTQRESTASLGQVTLASRSHPLRHGGPPLLGRRERFKQPNLQYVQHLHQRSRWIRHRSLNHLNHLHSLRHHRRHRRCRHRCWKSTETFPCPTWNHLRK